VRQPRGRSRRAQQPGKVPTIGFLGAPTPTFGRLWLDAFVQRLRELGWIGGLFPPGTLASVPLIIRLCAIVGGFAAFLFVRRSVLAGVAAGEVVLMLGALACGI
jgi:hypothetical protein